MYTACKGEFRDVQSDTYAKPFLHFFFFFLSFSNMFFFSFVFRTGNGSVQCVINPFGRAVGWRTIIEVGCRLFTIVG